MSELLKDFLVSPQRPEGTMDYHELCGFLFSVACSPELILPSEWISLIFNDQEPGYADIKQTEDIMRQIIGLYNEINLQVVEGSVSLPVSCQLVKRAMDNFNGPIAKWSRGFMEGYDWLSEVWDSCTPGDMEEELGSCLMILSYFADSRLAESYRENMSVEEQDEERLAQSVASIFNEAMTSYAQIGSTLYRKLNNINQVQQLSIKDAAGPARNDLCLCGSGKKYKHCCLH